MFAQELNKLKGVIMEWILLFVGFIAGWVARSLVEGSESEGESFWRHQYFILKNQGRDDVI